jgi:hypothetical protein
MPDFTPTDEQAHAAKLFRSGDPLVIVAGAGSGKTTTLAYMAWNTMRTGICTAFNRAIVLDTRKRMPDNVMTDTMHTMAMRDVGNRYRHRLDAGRRMPSGQIARLLGIDQPMMVRFAGEPKRLSPAFLAGVTQRMVTRFCQTADDEIDVRHMPYVDGLDPSPRSCGPTSTATAGAGSGSATTTTSRCGSWNGRCCRWTS